MTDSKTPAQLTPPPSSIQGKSPTPVLPQKPPSLGNAPSTTSQVPLARPPMSAGAPGAPAPLPSAPKPPVLPAAPSFASAPPAAPRPPMSGTPPAQGLPPRPPLASAPLPPAPPAGSVPPAAPSVLPATPQKAEVKQSAFRFLPLVLGVLLVLGLAFFIFRFFFGNKDVPSVDTTQTATQSTTPGKAASSVTLTYWGLWEQSPVVDEVLRDFESSHPGIKVNYQMQSYQDYRDRLQSGIASGRGPDVFRFHATWTPMIQNELAPMPDSVYTPSEFQSLFYPAATQLLSLDGKLYGVPLMYDGLALFYNEDALKAANVQPPQTWAELKEIATKLTIRSNNKIQRAGLAIGNATNVDHFSDILALLILQNGGSPDDPTSQNTLDALTFYTNFIKTDQVWDESFPNSTTAFARGDVAMFFAPSWRIHEIKTVNPNLKFGLVTVPQLTANKVTWASFWAEGVSSQSKYKTQSWELIKYLSSPEVLQKLYATASKDRAFGELYPRQEMASELANQPYANPYLSDAPLAKGWYLSSATHDNGLNDQIIKYYQDAVSAILLGSAPSDVAITVQSGVAQILRQYNVPGAPTSSSASTESVTTP
jgi:multiple sugar transport system substrate-binding protein